MTLDRRAFLATTAAFSFAPSLLSAAYQPASQTWRSYTLTTRVTLPRNGKTAQAWIPLPAHSDAQWTLPQDNRASGNMDALEIVQNPEEGYALMHARWNAGDEPAELTVISTVRTRDRSPEQAAPATLSDAEFAQHTAPTRLIPTDGIVLETAQDIVAGATSEREKAIRIYDWVVEQTERNPETRGCGLGDIASMLHMGDLTGKCADLNALYVGLARAAGLPARDLYGLRVAPSAFGYKSLGAGSADVTKAQHCRAEVFLPQSGWTPVDPADVRKVILQEAPEAGLTDPRVQDARAGLFGHAEGNWIALSTAHDVHLPGSADPTPVPFLMYPQAEVDGIRRDELDADSFAYAIAVEETTA
ncbi:transglutaminase-like domain-containing protein [Primorskyibacter sp. 2E107]|uniref:transglutaminase-like domain-containing protein n=1 Tax=Primorskyibacter sp. 2E107 TaxID=3403458 RepID=UPI003AF5AE31